MTVGARWLRLITRLPHLYWLEVWGISLASLVLGFLTLFVFSDSIGG